MEEEIGRKVKYFYKWCSPAGSPMFSENKTPDFFFNGCFKVPELRHFQFEGRHTRIGKQFYFWGHTYVCNGVCNQHMQRWLPEWQSCDWLDRQFGSVWVQSVCILKCLRKWASPPHKTYEHQPWESSLVGRSESWLEGRYIQMIPLPLVAK